MEMWIQSHRYRVALPCLACVALLAPAAVFAQAVRVVYLVPADRQIRQDYREAVTIAAADMQWFYQQQMADGRTFTLDREVLVLQSSHPASWFAATPGFGGFYSSARSEVEILTGRPAGSLHAGPDVWAIYVDALHSCGQCGGCGGNRVTVIDVNDLHGLVGEAHQPGCPGEIDNSTRCRFIGGLGHELGHAFGLPHPLACDLGLPDCDHGALMWSGYSRYPATYLLASDKATLSASPYLSPHPPLAQVAVCGPVPPAPPENFRAAVIGGTITFEWHVPQAGGAPTRYTLLAGSGPGLSNLARVPFSGPTTTFQATAPPGSYFVRLAATNAFGTSGPSNEIDLRVGLPGAPASLSASLHDRIVTLRWSAASGFVSGYLLEAGTQPGSTNLATIPITETMFVSPPLSPGRYYVRVRAIGQPGVGPPSNEIVIDVPAPALPGPPGALAATVAGSAVALSWHPPASGGPVIAYQLVVGNGPGLSNVGSFSLAAATSVTVNGVPPGVYYVRLRARSEAGLGPASTELRVQVP